MIDPAVDLVSPAAEDGAPTEYAGFASSPEKM
jgi:hypothetical protein